MIELPLTPAKDAERFRATGAWEDVTFHQLFSAAAARFGDKLAIIEKTRRFTYSQLARLVENLAGQLVARGVQMGEIIAIQSKNAAEFAILNMACSRIGCVYMPLHDGWRETELRHLLALTKTRLLIAPGEYRGLDHGAMIQRIAAELPSLEMVFTLGPSAAGYPLFDELLQPGPPAQARRLDPDAPANIMLSGGTTSISKISLYSTNNLLFMLRSTANGANFSDGDVTAALAPAGTGATGYLFPILMPLLYGATSVILERWADPAEAVELIAEHRCTYATGVPTQLTLMIPEIEKADRSRFADLRVFFSAGSALPYETGSKIEDLMGCVIQTGYGATDAGMPFVTKISDSREHRLRSVGRPGADFDSELRDADGNRAPPGQPGEVVWRGPGKSWAYLGPEAQTKAAFTEDHFYRSGDIGEFDESGYLYIVGRSKDMILRGGRNIFPRAVEELLIQHPSVLDVSVAAMPDRVFGERACAFVVPRQGKTLTFEDMIAFLRKQKIAVWQFPERLEIMDELPRGVGGKVLKSSLTAWIADRLKAEGVA